MEFLSCSGNCQLLWMVMKSRSPAKEYALFIVWASERGGRRRWGWTLHAERKEVEDSPVVAAVERWVLRWLDSFLPWLLEPFHGLLLVRWVFYSRAEQRPPRWLPRHRNLILSAVTLGPLVTSVWLYLTLCVRILLWGQCCYLKCSSNVTCCYGDTESLVQFTRYPLKIIFLWRQIRKCRLFVW